MSKFGLTQALFLVPALAYAERNGIPAERIFRKSALPITLLTSNSGLIPIGVFRKLLRQACLELDDQALPLKLSIGSAGRSLGNYGRTILAAPTLRDAILRSNELVPTVVSSVGFGLHVTGGTAVFSVFQEDPSEVGLLEHEFLTLGNMYELVRYFAEPAWAPFFVAVRSVESQRIYEEVFRCPIVATSPSGIAFDAAMLQSELKVEASWPGVPNDTAEQIPSNLESVVRTAIKVSTLEKSTTTQLDDVAELLQTSRRKLQRILRDEGLKFLELRKDVANEIARSAILQGRSVSEIAFELGYSDLAHFSRAFKSWNSMSPLHFRLAGKNGR
jgi:AraC-like DNA-binding protein